jgi:hypothetical protein
MAGCGNVWSMKVLTHCAVELSALNQEALLFSCMTPHVLSRISIYDTPCVIPYLNIWHPMCYPVSQYMTPHVLSHISIYDTPCVIPYLNIWHPMCYPVSQYMTTHVLSHISIYDTPCVIPYLNIYTPCVIPYLSIQSRFQCKCNKILFCILERHVSA